MSSTAYRLTRSDEQAISARIAETVTQWATHHHGHRPDRADLLILRRIGAHAIGCRTHDLRDVELDWIEDQAAQLAGLEPVR